ncbi:retinol dehydrogenase 11-like [Helicoverpa zea]|uniref:retinol dehydrogenase 11-like n=1 Tax=Helicoverpa zea TaxID=7113 RepID=UPI001F5620BF|nr:retinol dehydrogenase 11-like [Helicoverpa zea]
MIEFIIYFIVICMIAFKLYQKMSHTSFASTVRIPNKVVIVTGSNTGIGFETARELSKRGARVILACRDLQRAQNAASKIQSETGNDVIVKRLDLASFKSIHSFAEDIKANESVINILINNAGTGVLDNALTEDNLPIEAQVNHFGPFLLTMLLLPLMKDLPETSRIINVSSVMHKFGNVENLNKQADSFLGWRRVYSNTKLANVLFTKKLAEVVKKNNVTANCLHPGAVSTDIFRNQPRIVKFLLKCLFLTPVEGAQTSIYLALAEHLDNVSGKYFSNCAEETPSKKAMDREAADKLWDLSLKVCFGKEGQ